MFRREFLEKDFLWFQRSDCCKIRISTEDIRLIPHFNLRDDFGVEEEEDDDDKFRSCSFPNDESESDSF